MIPGRRAAIQDRQRTKPIEPKRHRGGVASGKRTKQRWREPEAAYGVPG